MTIRAPSAMGLGLAWTLAMLVASVDGGLRDASLSAAVADGDEAACHGNIACLARLRSRHVPPKKRCVVGDAEAVDCAFEWEACGREELGSGRFKRRAASFERDVLARFWPEPLLCRILAGDAAAARACPPTEELFSMSHGRCYVDDNGTDTALRSRASFRECVRGVPTNESHVVAVEDWFRRHAVRAGVHGDSVAAQLLWFWKTRYASLRGAERPARLEEVDREVGVDAFLNGSATTDFLGQPYRGDGGGGTLLLFNFGLHAVPAKRPVYERDVEALFDAHEALCAASAARGAPAVAVFLQTSAQHFETRTGGFFSMPRGWEPDADHATWDVPDTILTWAHDHRDKVRPPPRADMPEYPCRPASHGSATERWRNEVVATFYKRKNYRYVHVLPLGELTEGIWDAHVGNIWEKHLGAAGAVAADCTHFCYDPMLVEAVAFLLRRIIAVAEARAAEDRATFAPSPRPSKPPSPRPSRHAAHRTHRPTRFGPKKKPPAAS